VHGDCEWLDKTSISGRNPSGKETNCTFGHKNLFGHTPVASNAECHDWPANAELRISVEAGPTFVAGIDGFDGNWRSVGKRSCEFVTECRLKSKGEQMEIRTTDTRRSNIHNDSVANWRGYLNKF